MPRRPGRHFLQIPGPTNVPDRVLRAIDFPTVDHRGPEFGALGKSVLAGMKRVFKSTQGEVVIYTASGTGAWEAALVNTLSPGDRVLMYETGHFATLWQKMAAKLGLDVEFIAGDWRHGADPEAPARRPGEAHQGARRRAQRNLDRRRLAHRRGAPHDRRGRPSGAVHGRHDLFARVDRLPARRMGRRRHRRRLTEGPDAAAGPVIQLHLAQGACRIQVGAAAAQLLGVGRDDRQWQERLFPVHAGDQPALWPRRGAEDAARRGRSRCRVRAPPAPCRSHPSRGARVGAGDLCPRSARILRIGHLGDLNDLMLMGTLAGVEMGLALAGVPVKKEGVRAAMEYLLESAKAPARKVA